MVNNLDVNTQASVKLLLIKCTHACLYVQGRSVHWHLKLPHSPFHLSLLLNSHICILNLKLEILSQIAFCPFSVVPSFDVYLVIHRKKREIDYRQCHDMKMQGFAIIELELMLNDIDGKNIHFEAEERSLDKYFLKRWTHFMHTLHKFHESSFNFSISCLLLLCA